MNKNSFINGFSPVSYQEWKNFLQPPSQKKGTSEELQQALNKLQTSTYEGLRIHPLYTQEMVPPPQRVFPLPKPQWEIGTEISNSSLANASHEILQDYQGGCRHFFLSFSQVKDGQGLSFERWEDFQSLLAPLNLMADSHEERECKISLDGGEDIFAIAGLYYLFTQKKGWNPLERKGSFQGDPLSLWGLQGKMRIPFDQMMKKMKDLILWSKDHFPQMTCLQINTQGYYHAGANEVQDLAFALSSALFYLRYFTSQGIPFAYILSQLSFSFALGTDLFLSIAKVRAARILWAQILRSCSYSGSSTIPIFVRTSARVLSKKDPWVNILRSTVTALAGGVAGVEGMIVSPYDSPFAANDLKARRLSLNTQWLLQKEAGLSHVMDPGGGSYYLESLTLEMAKEAWSLFQQIEGEGGMEKSLREGKIQRRIAESMEKRMKNIFNRKEPITGVSEFPNLEERIPDSWTNLMNPKRPSPLSEKDSSFGSGAMVAETIEELIKEFSLGKTLKEIKEKERKVHQHNEKIISLVLTRLSLPFEKLRDQGEAYKKKYGKLPQVFLISLGQVSEHIERTNFMKNFLAIGGFDVLTHQVQDGDFSKMVRSLCESGLTMVALCSSEKNYEKWGQSLVKELRQLPLPQVSILLAGRPHSVEGVSREWGVDFFVYFGGQVYEILHELWQRQEKGKGGGKWE